MKPITSGLLIVSMIALFALAADPVFGQNAGDTGSDIADHVSSPFAGIEDFVDGVLSLQMQANDVAGATVAVVHGGDVVLSKGYGYADVDEQRVVDPVSTMFRIASITKLFTWTAVMQLVEKGELELDVDVQNYVDFVIPSAFGQPITLRDLMTHTAGFEDRAFAIASSGSAPSMPLGEWLATHIPARIWPPGDVVAYSNYGAALAGYIV
ncbi:MAG: class A beta-lactamase-related serine hydrolase, partial [Spirochaetales bacterium]